MSSILAGGAKGLLQSDGFATDPSLLVNPSVMATPYHLPLRKGGFRPGKDLCFYVLQEKFDDTYTKSDNRNTAVRRSPCVKGTVTVGDWGIVSGGDLDNLRILQTHFLLIHSLLYWGMQKNVYGRPYM